MLRALLAFSLVLLAGPAVAQVTNFSQDVARSIDLGLSYLDSRGAFNNPSAAGNGAHQHINPGAQYGTESITGHEW